MPNPLCILRALWWSLKTGSLVSGHDYAVSKQATPPNVTVLECGCCGKTSIGWDWTGFIPASTVTADVVRKLLAAKTRTDNMLFQNFRLLPDDEYYEAIARAANK